MVETNFKQTKIGSIPASWDVATLGDSCSIKARIGWQGLTTGEYLQYGDYYLISGTDFQNGFIKWNSCNFVSEWRFKQDKNIQIKEGDVLISKDGTIGKVAFLDAIPGAGTLNSGIFVVRPLKDDIIANYLQLAFKSKYFDDFIGQITAGSTIVHLYQRDIVTFTFPVPSKEEQRRIAEVLSDMDKLISALEKKIAKKQAIKQGAMQQLLTGKKRLPYYRKEWIEKKLGEVSEIYRGGSPRPIDKYITTDANGINWVKIGDVAPRSKFINATSEKIIPEGVLHSRRVFAGDFILSNSMSFGRPYILNINGCIHDGWLVIQNYDSTFDRDFLYYCLSSDNVMMQYIAMAAGSSVKNLNKEKVANVSLLFPADISEQKAIASILSSMDGEIEQLQQKLSKYKSLKQGMMQKLLTGQIRLI